MLGDIFATCPKMASRRLLMLSITCMRGDLVVANVILPADAEDLPLTFSCGNVRRGPPNEGAKCKDV